MQIVFALVALVAGFVLLVKGADWFVEGSAGIANKFGIPQIVIGLTIVAMGTSMPEAAVSISAALRGSAEITIGNVVGSNIMNILVILGLTAVVCQIAVQKTTIHYEIPMVIGVTILLAVMGLQNNIISRAEGVILLACRVVYTRSSYLSLGCFFLLWLVWQQLFSAVMWLWRRHLPLRVFSA